VEPLLLQALDRIAEHFRPDPRCLGMYLLGSIGRGTTDAYSDVDVALVTRDEHYAAVQAELRPLCEGICGPIVVWLPEGESEGFCNYAVLATAPDNRVLLYDFEIATETAFHRLALRPDRILFDHTGLLAAAGDRAHAAPLPGGGLSRAVDTFWVYAYLNGKYLRRGDLYKMLSVQNVLFQMHLQVLRTLHPGTEWLWWAEDVHRLGPEKERALLVYFGAASVEAIRAALPLELTMFAADATTACSELDVEYPCLLENAVRGHLSAMGFAGAGSA